MTNKVEVQFVQPELKVHTFRDKVLDKEVYFHVTKLTDSFCLWIGTCNSCGDLSVAMGMKGAQACSTVLTGGSLSHSQAMAQRLANKTGKQVFVGGDLNNFSQLELPLIEKRVAEEVKHSPEAF